MVNTSMVNQYHPCRRGGDNGKKRGMCVSHMGTLEEHAQDERATMESRRRKNDRKDTI